MRVHFQVVEGTRRRTQVFEGIVIKRQGTRRARDLHGPQAVVRRWRRAHVPAPLAEDRADRGGRAAATSAGPSSTTCASASAAAPACASAAGPARREPCDEGAMPRRRRAAAGRGASSPSEAVADEARGRGGPGAEEAAEAAEAPRTSGRARRRPADATPSREDAPAPAEDAGDDAEAARRAGVQRRVAGLGRSPRGSGHGGPQQEQAQSTGGSLIELVTIVAVALGLALGDPGVPRQAVPDPERVDGARRSRSASACSSTA